MSPAPSNLNYIQTPPPVKRPRKRPLRERSPVLAHIRSNLLTGLITAIPIFICVYIVAAIYGLVTKFTSGIAGWMVNSLLARMVHLSPTLLTDIESAMTPVVAVCISIFIVYILGLLGTFFVGRQILDHIEHFIENLPLVKGIYGTAKQVISVFRQGSGGHGFQSVALVEFPRIGTWTIGFVTNEIDDPETKQKLVCVFIPMTPNPTSGFFQMFPRDQVRATRWTVDQGIKIVLSGGLLAPQQLDEAGAAETVGAAGGGAAPQAEAGKAAP